MLRRTVLPQAVLRFALLHAGCVLEGEAERFNLYMRALKAQHQGDSFWHAVVAARISLINEEESGESEVTREEADAFMADAAPSVAPVTVPAAEDSDEIDLFGQME